MFIKGHLTFSVEGHSLEFVHQTMSSFGASGLPWPPLNPRDHFGKEVELRIRVPTKAPLVLETKAYIMREQTSFTEQMALKFLLTPEQVQAFNEHVKKNGFYPSDHIRKYPRIPSTHTVPTFPLQVIATGSQSYVFNIVNLSPNGILLSSENRQSLEIKPGDRLDLKIQPRGWFPMQIQMQGLVCRTVDDLDPVSGNITRLLGMKFVKIDEVNKAAFLDLLKDIIKRLNSTSPGLPGVE